MRKTALLAAVAVGVAFAVTLSVIFLRHSGDSTPTRASSRQQPDSQEKPAVAEPVQPGGQEFIHVDRWIPSSLDDLVKASQLVVVGTVTEAMQPEVRPVEGGPPEANIQKRERDYTVEVEQVLKGNAPSMITVVQVLSSIIGSESYFPDVLPLAVGARYVLFLREGTPGVWVSVTEPHRYLLENDRAIPELGSTAEQALGTRLEEVFPSVEPAALLSRIEAVVAAYPERVPIGALEPGSPSSDLTLPKPGDRVNLTRSLGLNVSAALSIDRGFTFKWGARQGSVEDSALLQRLASALDTLVTVEAVTGEPAAAGALPTVIFALTQPVLGVSTVGFIYDPAEGTLIYNGQLQLRLSSDGRSVLNEAIGAP